MLGMQSSDGTSGLGNKFLSSKMHADNTGFSHGSFNSNNTSFQGFADRNARRTGNVPSINTGARDQQHQYNATEQTPGTAYDMNFTPLLPTNLLLGSPFQPGSPGTFTSPQFSTFNRFPQANNALHQQTQQFQQNQQAQIGSPSQNHGAPLSPSIYQNMMSSEAFGSPQLLAGPQSASAYAGFGAGAYGAAAMAPQMGYAYLNRSSRTVYLGNIPTDTTAEEILGHVRSGQIESVRLLPDKNCAFISFIDSSSATHFHSDAILKKLTINGHDIKIGWGKPSQVPTSVAIAVQQSGASRNVYLGNLPEDITEQEIREDLGKFGMIDTVKLVREKAIGFVHFLSIANAIKAVVGLPQEPKWQPPRRVYYGKDRCAYVSKTQQQNAAQYLGIAPGYAHVLNGADRDLISNALAQQSVAAAAVATTAGGVNNLGNRTVYLGNIHPETSLEEICNVVRGGLLHHIRYIPDKHICFVTFIDPTSAASFYALSNLQGLMIHNRRLKIGWGKHSGALPPAIALAVSGGASRNVYIGNLDETWSEERLRQDFSEYGEIELVNALREKSCAFVNFTNIANAIKAIEAVRSRDEYKRFKINFGKDRCGNPPRQPTHGANNGQQRVQGGLEATASPPVMNGFPTSISQTDSSPTHPALSPVPHTNGSSQLSRSTAPPQPLAGPTPSAILNAGSNNPLTMYLSQVSQQQAQAELDQCSQPLNYASLQQQQNQALATQQAALYGDMPNGHSGLDSGNTSHSQHQPRQNSIGGAFAGHSASSVNSIGGAPITVGGLLAPTNTAFGSRSAHSRAVSLPAFSKELFGASGHNPSHNHTTTTAAARAFGGHAPQGSFGGFGSAFGTGFGTSGFGGLGLSGGGVGVGSGIGESRGLSGWAEEEVGAK